MDFAHLRGGAAFQLLRLRSIGPSVPLEKEIDVSSNQHATVTTTGEFPPTPCPTFYAW